MQVTITTRHVEVTPDIKARAEERVGKIAHFSDKMGDVAIVLSSERHLFQAELKTRSDGQDMVSRAEADDLRSALDAAAAKLERQVKDQRERMHARTTKPAAGDVVNPVEPPA